MVSLPKLVKRGGGADGYIPDFEFTFLRRDFLFGEGFGGGDDFAVP